MKVEKEQSLCTIKDNLLIGHLPAKMDVKTNGGIASELLHAFKETPNFVGQINVDTDEEITFGDLKDRSIRCALWLRKQGIEKNDVVCISTPHQSYDCVPGLATFYVGAVFNPWPHNKSHAIYQHFFKMIKPKVMFACKQSINRLVQAAKDVNVDCKFVAYTAHPEYPSLDDISADQTQGEVDNFQPTEPENPAKQLGVIFFSSGTTGIPKGTMLPYSALLTYRMNAMNFTEGMKILWYSYLSWITGTNLTTLCIIQRSVRILHSEFDSDKTSKIIEKYKVNLAFIPPSTLNTMYNAGVFSRYNYSSLKSIFIGGSKPSKAVLKETRRALPHTQVSNCYGITEFGGKISQQLKMPNEIDSVGHLVEGVTMKVIDLITGRTLGPNQTGELCFKKENMMLGYFNNPVETKKILDDDGWLHSGDLGYYSEDGEVTITDRIKELIITHGHHVSPSQIEEILMQHPEVADAAVVPVSHQIDIERPIAFVKKVPHAKVTEEELMELPTSFNEFYRISGGVIFVDELPYTSTGKKCRKDLREMATTYAR